MKTIIKETDIAAAVVKHLESQGLKVRQEVYVTLPDHGQICADIVACKTDETGEWFTVVECKRRLDVKLYMQLMRWLGLANSVFGAFMLAKRVSGFQHSQNRKLAAHGIGRMRLDAGGCLHTTVQRIFSTADTHLLSAAFHSHDGSHDPPAGSKTAKRMTDSRCVWEPATAYLRAHGADDWKGIRRMVPSMRGITSRQAVKAVDKGEWVGVVYDGGCPFTFSYKGVK